MHAAPGREDFPLLAQSVNSQPLVYLDNGATTQKPQAVLDALAHYYEHDNANVHRGAHALAARATDQFEAARDTVAGFINAARREEIVWTTGTTGAINLVAHSYGQRFIGPDDAVLISEMEHHSNIVPWQLLCERTGAELRAIPVTAQGELDLSTLDTLLDERVKLVSVVHVSNALGTVNPVRELIQRAHAVGAVILLDGAQSIGHMPVDVQELDVDFLAFSAHKLFGPTGMGVLYGRYELLDAMPPFLGGGEMIERVQMSGSTYQAPPLRFEAGTPNIADVIATAAGIDYLNTHDRTALAAHEATLLARCHALAAERPWIRVVGESAHKAGAFSFLVEGAHPGDVGTLLDQQGVAVRTGHHCAQPLMDKLGIPGTVRASFSFYNTLDEVERLFAALDRVREFL